MLPLINKFFNKCLITGKLPQQWKYTRMKLLYKNKGKLNDCNSYRGICLSNTLCKLLDKILANRILSHFHDIIPPEQYGFMPGRSTIQAATHFHQKLTNTITTKGTKTYAIFIDLTKAFDLSDRTILFKKILEKNKLSKTELNLLAEFLQCDLISIDDGISQSEPFVQSNGVKQGMNSSPLLFNIYIHDIIKIFEGIEGVEFFFYADDMVFLCESLDLLNTVMQKFMLYAAQNFLQPNFSKTKLMKFTVNGLGKYSTEELNFSVDGEKIEFVKCFPYLGIYFQRDCRNFSAHVVQRKKNSILAMNMYGDLRKLSIDCAKKLFKIKFAPMASYGIEVIWPFLSVKDFKELEKVKSRYLKRVLGVHKNNKNTYVYRLAEEALFVEELQTQYGLPPTENFVKFLSAYKLEHETRFNAMFLETPAMRNNVWKQPLFEKDRHVFTRYAIHGFHNQICNQTSVNKQCFIESDQCVCILCGEKCTQYHLAECNKRVQSLNVYATSNKN
jgi:Reverse transcriptase (RNA-dependent DNA polymerase)